MPPNVAHSEPRLPLTDTATLVYGRAGLRDLHAEHHRAERGSRSGAAVVMVHGGAWTTNDRHTPSVLCTHLAEAGFDVFSLDFRDGRNGKHPCAVQDIAAGVRFARANAGALGLDGERIGLIGSSSGGHLALLAATQPDIDAHRGTSILVNGAETPAAEVSAQVRCVAALWPVSNPLLRFHYAQRAGREELVRAHQRYFVDEAQMRAASVPRLLAAGEATHVPPLLLAQPGEDANVPRRMTLDLVHAYQEAGGALHYLFLPELPHAFAYQASDATTRLAATLGAFFREQLGVPRRGD